MLKVDWVSHEAAKYVCVRESIPIGKLIKVGAWEDDKFIGVVMFSRGANKSIGGPYGLKQTECCELTRVALTNHQCFVSELLAKAIKFLKEFNLDLQLIVSYADIDQNHHGGIYQATNWIYEGKTSGERYFIVNGKKTHPKSIHAKYGTGFQRLDFLRKHVDPFAKVHESSGKHKYLMPLNKKIRKKIISLSKPYPK